MWRDIQMLFLKRSPSPEKASGIVDKQKRTKCNTDEDIWYGKNMVSANADLYTAKKKKKRSRKNKATSSGLNRDQHQPLFRASKAALAS